MLWQGLACCPPNITRFNASLAQYVYSIANEGIYVNLYAGTTFTTTIKGSDVVIRQETNFPYDRRVDIP